MVESLNVPVGGLMLPADLDVPEQATSLVVFAHGAGSSRLSPRNRFVASRLSESGAMGTLLFDLLTPEEDADPRMRFDIGLLADRLEAATRYFLALPDFSGWPLGFFGASTGAAAAIVAGVRLGGHVEAIVSRGGRPDLAGGALDRLTAATLLIVGGRDTEVLRLNEDALEHIPVADKRLEVVPGATHLFEEPGALDVVATLATQWFERYLGRVRSQV